MTPRERLTATLKGEKVDRPAVSFYEIGGFDINPDDPDEYNVYNHPSWRPLWRLANDHTDIIRLASPVRAESHSSWGGTSPGEAGNPVVEREVWEEGDDRFARLTYRLGRKKLTSLTLRNKVFDTVWTVEHLLKTTGDVQTFLQIPDEVFEEEIDLTTLLEQEKKLGESGILMVDTEDPICAVATLFSMDDFTVFAFTEPGLCHRLLEKHARYIYKRTETVARDFPGRLWRIYGPEFASEPFLPPHLFQEYVVRYDQYIVDQVQRYKGFVRLHSHGNLNGILDHIAGMKVDGIDPIEPPPQGDVDLEYVAQKYGAQMVLFGNLEISDIEHMPADRFRQVVRRSIAAGTEGNVRGFVLMPSSSPCGREVSELTLRNYQVMIEEIQNFDWQSAPSINDTTR
jgi:uroporphyrinogen-III decarboxylase